MTSSQSGNTTADLLQSLSADVSALVRQELHQAQEELAGKARQAGQAGALLGGAGVFGALAAGSSAVLLVRVLDRWMSPTAAAALATGLYAAGAGVLAAGAAQRLRQALPVVPERTVASLRQDARAAADTNPGSEPNIVAQAPQG